MKIAITGGAGFVGGHLAAQLRALGHQVTILSRKAPPNEKDFIPFALENRLPPADLQGFDALIHAAWDFSCAPELNVENSIRLFDSVKAAGVPRLLFISSLSAFEGCRSQYGTTKLAVEKHVTALGGCSIRLGFVCDDSGRGLSGSLKKLAAMPVVPLPGGGKQNLFTIWAEDLGSAFLRILDQCAKETVSLAHPEPVSLASMMRVFAEQQGKRPLFLPFPWRLLWAPLRVMEAAGLKLKFRSDSLVSLMNQDPNPDFRFLTGLDINLRPFVKVRDAHMARS
jgi:nucleoside-diphosphate-sugar epimerase